jgi:hypothetical protein
MATTQKPNRKRVKFTGSARVTLAALSVISFVGGWDLIARLDNQEAQASPKNLNLPQNQSPQPTPWPTIAPLTNLPPIPTLIPTQTASQVAGLPAENTAPMQPVSVPTLAPLPALAPLPPMPELPALPPPVAAQTWNGNGNHSGGS